MSEPTRVELARDSDAVDLDRFTTQLGLHTRRRGMTVEIYDEPDVIGDAVGGWLAEWHAPLVPTRLADGSLALRPPAD